MSLNIVVLAKQVPDTRNVGKDAMKEDGTINRAALPAIFNPEDLNALEQALRLKDANPGSTVTITYLLNGEKVSYTVPNNHNYTSGGLVGTDDLGRKLYTTADENIVSINSKEGERYVGLFYFLWHGEHGDSGIFDMQKILEEQGAVGKRGVCWERAHGHTSHGAEVTDGP